MDLDYQLGEPAIRSACPPQTVSTWSAFLVPFLPLFTGIRHLAHVLTVPPTKVWLLYTRKPVPIYTGHACRHWPSAVPWISEDRLLCSRVQTKHIVIMQQSAQNTVIVQSVDRIHSNHAECRQNIVIMQTWSLQKVIWQTVNGFPFFLSSQSWPSNYIFLEEKWYTYSNTAFKCNCLMLCDLEVKPGSLKSYEQITVSKCHTKILLLMNYHNAVWLPVRT